MEQASSATKRRSRAWLPWALLAGTALVAGLGGLTFSRATGHASFRPVVPSDSPQNRLRNRRVVLTLSPMPLPPPTLVAAVTPTPPPAPPKEAPRAKGGKKAGRR